MPSSLSDREFDEMMEAAFAEPEPPVPAGLLLRMEAWTSVEMEAQRRGEAAPSTMGLLPQARSNRGAFLFSMLVNLVAALFVVVVSFHRTLERRSADVTTLYAPPVPVAEPRKPVPPPRMVPPTPDAQPRLDQPRVEPAPVPQPLPVMARHFDVPVPAPSAAVHVESAPAPRAVSLGTTQPSSTRVAKAAPVALGRVDSPAAPVSASAARVTLGVGSMAARERTSASAVSGFGTPQPAGKSYHGTAAAPVTIDGVAPAPVSPGNGGRAASTVNIAPLEQRMMPVMRSAAIASLAKPPVVTYLPTPVYPAEAKALHLQGDVELRVRFKTDGTLEVLGVTRGLGHGMDESALEAAKGIRFRAATDTAGAPIEFTTVVKVHFVLN